MDIQTFIQDEMLLPRLRRNGVLVLYDPAQRYRTLCLALASDTLRWTRRKQYRPETA
jgi:hypothetical protein